MSDRLELRRRRHEAIQKFLDENAELFGVSEDDDVGEGPFFLTDWCLVLHLRDASIDDYSTEPPEVHAAFFRPGMGFSHKLGMVEALRYGIQFPRIVVDDDDN